MNYTKSISKLLTEIKKAYIADQEAKGIRSSGASAKSLRTKANPTSGTLTGSAYFYQQMHGRRPGKFPPISEILEWIKIKGITPRDSSTSIKSLAFLFARKIAQSGTDIYQKKRPALDPGEKVQTLVAAFSREIGKDLRKEIITALK